jgi:hypothetical protein
MILYKYTNIEVGCKILVNKSVRFTQPQYLNDPFDMRPDFSETYFDDDNDETQLSDFGDKQNEIKKEEIDGYYQIINRDVGIFCLTEKPNNSLMWSHYADNHKGILIGFDTDNDFLNDNNENITVKKIIYNNSKLKIKDIYTENEFNNSLLEKSKDWEYENEWRSIRLLNEADSNCGEIHLFNFDPIIIKEIYFGANIAQCDKEIILHILKYTNNYKHIKLFQIEIDNSSYDLKIEEIAL